MEAACSRSRKRKISELMWLEGDGDESPRFPLNDLNQDLLERVLSWLPTSSFLRLTSVCKRCKSVAHFAAFMLACFQVPARRPWFFMVNTAQYSDTQQPFIVFDTAEADLKKLNPPPLLRHQDSCPEPTIPVAAAGGLRAVINELQKKPSPRRRAGGSF